MRTPRLRVIPLVMSALLLILLAACGGGGAAPVGADLGGTTNSPPALNGDQTGQFDQGISIDVIVDGDLPAPEPIQGQSAVAPLGTDPEYSMTLLGGSVTDFSAPKEGSMIAVQDIQDVLPLSEDFSLLGITMSLAGEQPDMGLGSATFNEGEKVSLWMHYAVQAGIVLDRHWISDAIGLDLIEEDVEHLTAGFYEVKLDFAIPYGSATDTAVFSTTLSNDTSSKESDPFPYEIKDSLLMPLITYPGPYSTDSDDEVGIWGGHCDVDTSSFISSIGNGSTDGHVHAYDDEYDVVGVNYFNVLDDRLHSIAQDVSSGTQKFKLIISNADLSTGGRLVINNDYIDNNNATYEMVDSYDDEYPVDLPIYSLDGVAGTTQLSKLGLYFDENAIATGGLIPTNTGDVRGNVLGKYGEWRNGALTIQAVAVNADGTDGFTTDTSLSSGGVQGVATSGLLWESTIFWHWSGPSYHQEGWEEFGAGNNDPTNSPRMAQMGWEDLINNSDYDYNDLVIRMHATEYRNNSNQLIQIDLIVKATARGAGYDADWQFNMDAALPGTSVIAIVDQYYDNEDGNYTNDLRHGLQRIWVSAEGTSIPVFTTARDALPNPPEGNSQTNTIPGTTYIAGDYARVKIILDTPLDQGAYSPMPYKPELRVIPHSGYVYILGLWREPGDPLDSNGRPLGFIVPDVYPWPLEFKQVWNVYEGFNDWVTWINNPTTPPQDPLWLYWGPVADYFDPSLFN